MKEEMIFGYYNWLNSKGIQISVNERDSTLWVPVQQAWEQEIAIFKLKSQ